MGVPVRFCPPVRKPKSMDVSVVVPTLNGREQLAAALDTIAEHAPSVEVVVVNGPSADGTSGMVRDRDDVDVLVDLDERNINVARNAGLERAGGDVVAYVEYDLVIEEGWLVALREGLAAVPAVGDERGAVTGPTHRRLRAGVTTEKLETREIRGRDVRYFGGGNVAFRREALEAIDGFDEYLVTGGARDAAHRLAGLGYEVAWQPGMSVARELEADGGITERDWRWRYRSLVYRLVKSYGLRPSIAYRIVRHAGTDGYEALQDVLSGEGRPTEWLGNGRDVLGGTASGLLAGLRARFSDRSPKRNPNGWSRRTDRAVAVLDRR
jgi:glycosyltransferase involved in cell wall biosynthesis